MGPENFVRANHLRQNKVSKCKAKQSHDIKKLMQRYRIYCNKRPPYNKCPSPISAPFDTKIII